MSVAPSESKTPIGEKKEDPKITTYRKMALETIDFSVKLMQDSGWTLKFDEGGSTVWNMPHPTCKKTVWRARTVLDMPANVVFDLMIHIETYPLWRSNIKGFEVLESVAPQLDITRFTIRGQGTVKDRDFVDLRYWMLDPLEPGRACLSFTSVPHDSAPPTKDPIRGENLLGYFIVAPHKEDPSRTEMTWVYCSDIKGWVPAWVIDAATTSIIRDGFKEFGLAGVRVREGWSEYKGYETEQAKASTASSLRWRTIAAGVTAMDAACSSLQQLDQQKQQQQQHQQGEKADAVAQQQSILDAWTLALKNLASAS